MKKVLLCVLYLMVTYLFAQSGTLADYANKMDECYRVELKTKTICCMVNKSEKDKRFGDKVLLLLDNQNNVIDEFSFYDANNSNTYFISNEVFVVKGKILDPHQEILIYVSDNDAWFKKMDCENWVADILVTDDYVLYSTEFDNDTIRRITIETNEMISYKGYYPNVTIFPTSIPSVLGIFEYQNKWYKIQEDEIVETDETFNTVEKRNLKKQGD